MAKELIYPLIINYRPTINFLKYSKKIFIYFDVHVVWIDLSYHVKKNGLYANDNKQIRFIILSLLVIITII